MSALEQQMKHRDRDMVPLFLVRSMFGLMFAALALVAYAQWTDVPQSAVFQKTPAVQEIQVQFVSSREGVSTVFDMDDNRIAASGDASATRGGCNPHSRKIPSLNPECSSTGMGTPMEYSITMKGDPPRARQGCDDGEDDDWLIFNAKYVLHETD